MLPLGFRAPRRWLALLALCSASLIVYWLGLLLPYNLFVLQLRPLRSIALLTRGDPVAQVRFVLTFAALSGLYYLMWKLCRGRQPKAMWIALIAPLLAANLTLIWLYPVGAADLFDNIARGRITAQYGGNPFYETPNDFRRDIFRYYVAWPHSTSAYGPLWELLAAGTSRIAGDGKLANVLGFKALGLIFYFGSIALVAGILQRHAPERALQGACLFAWNPLVIYETAGNGHNDIVMVFCILLGLYAVLGKRFTLATLALTAGALIKFIPLLLLPVAVAAGLRAQRTRGQRLRFALSAGLVCVALIVALSAPFWRGGDPFGLERRERMFTTSLPAALQARLELRLGTEASQQIVRSASLFATGLVVVFQTWRAWRENDWLAPIRASAFILLFYLLFTCLWFQPWYVIWPLALAAILPEGAAGRIAVLLSYAAVWKPIVFNDIIVREGSLPPRVWRETLLGPILLGLVWLYAAYASFISALNSKRSNRNQESGIPNL